MMTPPPLPSQLCPRPRKGEREFLGKKVQRQRTPSRPDGVWAACLVVAVCTRPPGSGVLPRPPLGSVGSRLHAPACILFLAGLGPGRVRRASSCTAIYSLFSPPRLSGARSNGATNLVCVPLSLPAVRGWPGWLVVALRDHSPSVTRQLPLPSFPLILPLPGVCRAVGAGRGHSPGSELSGSHKGKDSRSW